MVETLQPRRFGAGQQTGKSANSGRGLAAVFDFAVASHLRATLFLILCGVVLFIPAGFWFGNLLFVKKQFHYVIFAIIFLSILPAIIEIWRERRRGAAAARDAAG